MSNKKNKWINWDVLYYSFISLVTLIFLYLINWHLLNEAGLAAFIIASWGLIFLLGGVGLAISIVVIEYIRKKEVKHLLKILFTPLLILLWMFVITWGTSLLKAYTKKDNVFEEKIEYPVRKNPTLKDIKQEYWDVTTNSTYTLD